MGNQGVYAIRHTHSGMNYVGSSMNLHRRRTQHFVDLRGSRHCNVHLQRAFDKYSEDAFEWIVLEEVTDAENLIERERFWINELSATNKGNGYNIALDPIAPMRGRRFSSKTKAKLSDLRKGSLHPRAKINESDVLKICDMHKQGKSQCEISNLVGVDQTNVSLILRDKAWRHVISERNLQAVATNNTSGCTGVYYARNVGKWVAEIIKNGVHYRLGTFVDLQEAIKARKEAEWRLSSDTK
jgi:group I intron endonuclease